MLSRQIYRSGVQVSYRDGDQNLRLVGIYLGFKAKYIKKKNFLARTLHDIVL